MARYISMTGLLLCVAVLLSSPAYAGVTLFLSDKGPGEGPSPGAPSVSVAVDSTIDLYLWADVGATGKISGLGLDIEAETSGKIEATVYDVENPQETLFNSKDRWDGVRDDFTLDELVTGCNAVHVTSDSIGIDGNWSAYDPTYDSGSGCFLVGTITIKGVATGSTDVYLVVNEWLIASSAASVGFGTAGDTVDPTEEGADGTYADATITVTE